MILKPIDKFSKLLRGPGGINYRCKTCTNKESREWAKKNKDKIRAYNQMYRDKYSLEGRRHCRISDETKAERRLVKRKQYHAKFDELAKIRGGLCISGVEECLTTSSKLKIRCLYGHEFKASLRSLTNYKWCPQCSVSLGELITIKAMECITGKPFVKVRPDWLKHEGSDRPLELDGYNEEFRMAVEYNGMQHYKLSRYSKTPEELLKRQQYDQIKTIRCAQNFVYLIVVPYTVPYGSIYRYLLDCCKSIGCQVDETKTFDWSQAFIEHARFTKTRRIVNGVEQPIQENGIVKIKGLIDAKGGTLLDVLEDNILHLRCKEGHEWKTKYTTIRDKRWCPTCGHVVKDETKIKLSEALKKYHASEEGKQGFKLNRLKHSETMRIKREERQSIVISEQQCITCFSSKDISEFYKSSKHISGYQTVCKVCDAARKRKPKEITETHHCTLCLRTYQSKASLSRHIRINH